MEGDSSDPIPLAVIPTPPVYSGSLTDLPPAYAEISNYAAPSDIAADGYNTLPQTITENDDNAIRESDVSNATNFPPLSGHAHLSDVRLTAAPIGEPPPIYSARVDDSEAVNQNSTNNIDQG